MPVCRLLVHAGNSKELFFAQCRSEELQANREGFISRREAAGDADAGEGGDVAGHREDIHQVHLKRVASLFADFEGWGRRRWADDRVALLEGVVEILLDQG